jgi:hypothetical protein
LQKQLFEYETSLEQNFDFPFTGICAYNKEDINKYLSLEEIKSMQNHHNPVWE